MDRFAAVTLLVLAAITCCEAKPAKAGDLARQPGGPHGEQGFLVEVKPYSGLDARTKKLIDGWAQMLRSNVTASLKQDKVDVNQWKVQSNAWIGKSGCCASYNEMLIKVNDKSNGYVLVSFWFNSDGPNKNSDHVSDILYLPNQKQDAKYVSLRQA